jgi:phosphoribosylamine--glycine ligase
VIEFNARFGDPETQVVLALLKTQLSHVLQAAADGQLADFGPLQWHPGSAVTVVMAAENYPGTPVTGDSITIGEVAELEGPDEAYVLHAGTASVDGATVTAGGRVLSVVATGSSLAEARAHVYEAVNQVEFRGRHFRTDIALAAAEDRIHIP